jgi:rhamnose utilization protein RhaD (predicted bifunctional aldolase and dehydrogenase)
VLEEDGSFWVKASGTQLRTVTRQGFVRVSLARAMAMLGAPHMPDDDVLRSLLAARVDGNPEPLPSVETAVHAACLSMPGVRFVGHTHPTPINSLTCSRMFHEVLAGRLFPDEVVVCGPAAVLVAYTDPGLPLARAVHAALRGCMDDHGGPPKTVHLQNHGLIALGATAREVENITAMAVKSARILLGALAAGGPNFLPASQVQRLHNRADEHYRRRIIGNGS